MTWELGYFYGLFTGGATVGLIGLFVHAGYWERWARRLKGVEGERDAETSRLNRWQLRDDSCAADLERERAARRGLARVVEGLRNDLASAEAFAFAAGRARDYAAVLAERDAAREERDAALAAEAAAVSRANESDAHAANTAQHFDELIAERDAALAKADAINAVHMKVMMGLRDMVRLVEFATKGCA